MLVKVVNVDAMFIFLPVLVVVNPNIGKSPNRKYFCFFFNYLFLHYYFFYCVVTFDTTLLFMKFSPLSFASFLCIHFPNIHHWQAAPRSPRSVSLYCMASRSEWDKFLTIVRNWCKKPSRRLSGF